MLTRRRLLARIGLAAGLGPMVGAMDALGIGGVAHAEDWKPLPVGTGAGRSVVVLGAGIAGLTAAFELEQAGFFVTLLEARDRVGGRAWTLRDGDKLVMNGEETQTARFSDGIYMNAGPARIPSFHQGLLGYAKRFGVAMEVEVNASRSAYVVGADGARLRMRTAINDTRGHIAELLAKAINQGALDRQLSADEKARMLPFLKAYGDLGADGRFTGTDRSGFTTYPGADVTFASPSSAVPLDQLLANQQLPMSLFDENIYMQATMFEPVGGMDRIHAGFDRALRRPALRGAEVIRIRHTARGVETVYRDTASGVTSTVHADYMVCTIPFPVLGRIDSDFAPATKAAIKGVQYDYSNKVGFESPRFWEADQIYGGISFVGAPTALIWYPSAGLHSSRGMILGCYNSGQMAAKFQERSVAEQIAAARAAIEKTHPGHGADLANPLVVNWHKVPFSEGPWPAWLGLAPVVGQEAHIDTPPFRLLQKPDGRVYFASAALSQTPGWQEGGIQSARRQIAALAARAAQEPSSAPSHAA